MLLYLLQNSIIQYTPDILPEKDNYLLAYIYPSTPFITNELIALQESNVNFTVATINCQVFTSFCSNITVFPAIQYTYQNHSYTFDGIKSKTNILKFVTEKQQPIENQNCDPNKPCVTVFYTNTTDLSQFNNYRGKFNFHFKLSENELLSFSEHNITKTAPYDNIHHFFSALKFGLFPELQTSNFQELISGDIAFFAVENDSDLLVELKEKFTPKMQFSRINATVYARFLENFDVKAFPALVVILKSEAENEPPRVFKRENLSNFAEIQEFLERVEKGVESQIEIRISSKIRFVDVFVIVGFGLIVVFSVWWVCIRKEDDEEEEEQSVAKKND